MIVLDRLLIGGIRFVLDKVVTAAEAELDNPDRLREELLAAQMQLELGEIGDEEFAAVERDVLARLRELRGETERGPISFTAGGASAEVSFSVDEEEGGGGGGSGRDRR
jgi:hypothetical protein